MNGQQKEYGEFAERAFEAGAKTPQNIFFAEGQSGIDRVLGYLVPALKRVSENPSERILICVANSAKQKRIFEKEIPEVFRRLELDPQSSRVRPAIFKERFSYVCLRKLNDCIDDAEHRLTVEERVIFLSLITWAGKTKDGDLNEVLHYNRSPILYKKVACEPVSCLGEKCGRSDECHFQKAKKEAANSNILLVSHQLFLQDLNLDFAVLPLYAKAVFDDAHRLHSASSRAFGRNLYFYALRNAIKQNAWCDKWAAPATESEKAFLSLLKSVQEFSAKAKKRKIAYSQALAAETGISPENLQNALSALLECVEQARAEFSADSADEKAEAKAKDCAQFASDIRKIKSDLTFFFAASHSEFIYWVESSSNPYQVSFNAEPVNAGFKWHKNFYPAVQSTFFTSDVLSIGGRFDYMASCLGLGGSRRTEGRVFAGKSEGELPSVVGIDFLPKPTEQNFNTELVKALCELLPRNPENTIVFCDFGTVQKLTPALMSLPSIAGGAGGNSRRVFSQGIDGNFYNLFGFFKGEAGSILLGTADEIKNLENAELPENLFLALCRLPFPDLKDPVMEARQNLLKSQGKNAFALLTMPETILTLRKLYAAISNAPAHKDEADESETTQGKRTLFLMDSRIFSEQYGLKIQKIWDNFTQMSHRVFSNGERPCVRDRSGYHGAAAE